MKFRLIVFSCLFIIRDDIFVKTSPYVPLGIKDTTLEEYPFIATVLGSVWLCPAVLITRQHLLMPAFCVDRETTITVYFSLEHLPFYLSPPYGNTTQIYNTSRIFKHERFTNATNKDHFVNDIAVVELEQPIIDSETIRPAKLISEEELVLFEKEATAQVIGWYHDRDSVIRVETVAVMDRDVCEDNFGNSFMYDQEWCALSAYEEYLALVGNVMLYKNKVVGFMAHDHTCLSYSPECSKIHTYSNIAPFLKWISEKVGVSVEELTGTDLRKKLSEALRKIEEQAELIRKLDATFQQEKTNTDRKLDEILSQVGSQKQTQTELDKQLDNVNSEVEKIKDSKIQDLNLLEKKMCRLEQDSLSKNEVIINKITGIENFREVENERFKLLEERVNDLENNFKFINQTLSKIWL